MKNLLGTPSNLPGTIKGAGLYGLFCTISLTYTLSSNIRACRAKKPIFGRSSLVCSLARINFVTTSYSAFSISLLPSFLCSMYIFTAWLTSAELSEIKV